MSKAGLRGGISGRGSVMSKETSKVSISPLKKRGKNDAKSLKNSEANGEDSNKKLDTDESPTKQGKRSDARVS